LIQLGIKKNAILNIEEEKKELCQENILNMCLADENKSQIC